MPEPSVPSPGNRRAGGRLPDHVRQQLDVPRRRQVADAVQLAELVHPPGVLARDELPLALLLVASEPAPRVHAPDLLLLLPEAQLVQRDPELGGPALRVVGHLAVPDGVPRRVPLQLAVAEDEVDLAAARGEVELEAGALVVVAVEADPDDVDRVLAEVVAAARVVVDLVRVVVGADRVVEVLVVVEDLELGLLRRGRALDGHVLRVVPGPLALRVPRLVVEPAVDDRRLHDQALRGVDAGQVLPAERVGRSRRRSERGRRRGRTRRPGQSRRVRQGRLGPGRRRKERESDRDRRRRTNEDPTRPDLATRMHEAPSPVRRTSADPSG